MKKEDYEMLTDSIKFMIRMGIIGDMRTPEHQIETQFSIFLKMLPSTQSLIVNKFNRHFLMHF